MRIEVRRTGGVAGIARRWEVDTSSLARDRAWRIETLARAVAGSPLPGADAFTYELTIDGEVVVVGDAEELVEAMSE